MASFSFKQTYLEGGEFSFEVTLEVLRGVLKQVIFSCLVFLAKDFQGASLIGLAVELLVDILKASSQEVGQECGVPLNFPLGNLASFTAWKYIDNWEDPSPPSLIPHKSKRAWICFQVTLPDFFSSPLPSLSY